MIAFDRGGQIGEARYTLAPGGYSFTVKTSGWDLVQKSFKVTLDDSAKSGDFDSSWRTRPAWSRPAQSRRSPASYPSS